MQLLRKIRMNLNFAKIMSEEMPKNEEQNVSPAENLQEAAGRYPKIIEYIGEIHRTKKRFGTDQDYIKRLHGEIVNLNPVEEEPSEEDVASSTEKKQALIDGLMNFRRHTNSEIREMLIKLAEYADFQINPEYYDRHGLKEKGWENNKPTFNENDELRIKGILLQHIYDAGVNGANLETYLERAVSFQEITGTDILSGLKSDCEKLLNSEEGSKWIEGTRKQYIAQALERGGLTVNKNDEGIYSIE
jgi:hypothetical protein